MERRSHGADRHPRGPGLVARYRQNGRVRRRSRALRRGGPPGGRFRHVVHTGTGQQPGPLERSRRRQTRRTEGSHWALFSILVEERSKLTRGAGPYPCPQTCAITRSVTIATNMRAAKAKGEDAMPEEHIPMNVYRENERIMVSAPVPGMEPSNIHIQVEGRKLTIKSKQRGPGQDRTGQYIQQQWTAGPYHGVVTLPAWVDVEKANATYDNGVLVIIFPEAQASTSGVITMDKIGTSKGQIVGHVGKDLHSP